ncbi:hypothetical protein SLA2020_199690 [Shorea laevis]
MRKSPVHPKDEASDFGGYEIDAGVNFSEFLEEARQYAREVHPQESYGNSEVTGEKRLGEGEKRRKKSWKSSLFSWWKAEKKSNKPSMHPANAPPRISKPKKGYVSGPICGNTRVDTRSQRPSSGPLTILFNPTKKEEAGVPYMCLDQQNNSHYVNAYGPIYLVT